jgi:hypothetical protein
MDPNPLLEKFRKMGIFLRYFFVLEQVDNIKSDFITVKRTNPDEGVYIFGNALPPWVGGYQLMTFEGKIVKEIEKRGKI